MTPQNPHRPPAGSAALTTGLLGGYVINLLFAATVLLFLAGLLAIGPAA